MVKLEFAASQSPQVNPWIMARPMFDSLSQPLTAGVRSGAPDSRQLMFETEGTMVDLVLDTHTRSGKISLVGQVIDKGGTRVSPREVAVILWTETGQPLAETSANEFGEFQMEVPVQDRLRLSVQIAGYAPVRIPPINLNPDAMRTVTKESGSHY
jgi:tRNA A37 threonylcarbamoyladenosine synthetase subunit TsaC/SUA5/YrdC